MGDAPWGGNLMRLPVGLYYQCDPMCALRDRSRSNRGCEECSFACLRRGGPKCLSPAVSDDPFTADPRCWHATGHTARLSNETQPINGQLLAMHLVDVCRDLEASGLVSSIRPG